MEPTLVKVSPQNPITGLVLSITDYPESKFGPSYNVDVDPGDGSVQRITERQVKINEQLGRIGLNPETAIGKVLKFWKKPMADDPTKGYLNIDHEATPERLDAPKPTPKHAAPAPAPVNSNAHAVLENEMAWAWNTALTIMTPTIKEWQADGFPDSIRAVQAMAATLLIQSMKR